MTSKEPWKKSSSEYIYQAKSFSRGGLSASYKCKVTKEYIEDSEHQLWRKGDIVKFEDGFYPSYSEPWKNWFLSKNEKSRLLNRDYSVPLYAREEFAIIIGRYRKVKHKWTTFRDYGAVVMMLSGSRTGHCRHYWSKKPFRIYLPFGKKITNGLLTRQIDQSIIDLFNASYEDSNKGRNELVSKVHRYYNGGS